MLEFIQIPKREFKGRIAHYETWFGTTYIAKEGTEGQCVLARIGDQWFGGNFVEEHGLVYIDVEVPNFYA